MAKFKKSEMFPYLVWLSFYSRNSDILMKY